MVWPRCLIARQLLRQRLARCLIRIRLPLLFDVASAPGGFVETMFGRLNTARRLEFVQKISSRDRRRPLGQQADKLAADDIAVLKQQNGLQFRIARRFVTEHLERGTFPAIRGVCGLIVSNASNSA